MVKHITYKYPPYSLDSLLNDGGGTLTIRLQRNALISKYKIYVVLGQLNGGTSPTWTVSKTNPIITQLSVISDNDTIIFATTDMLQEYNYLFQHVSPNGLSFSIPMSDYTAEGNKEIEGTQFDSTKYINNELYVTVPPLSQVTSGSPSSSSGTYLYLVEEQYTKRPSKLVTVKKLTSETTLSITGENELVPDPFLTTDGAYKMVLYQQSQNGVLSDNYILSTKIELNGRITIADDYISTLKLRNQSIFKVVPDVGYFAHVFMEDENVKDLLPLVNPAVVTSVKEKFITNTSPVTLKALKVEYMV